MDDGFFDYLEANLLANPPLPASVNYVLASIPKLFGTDLGNQVRNTLPCDTICAFHLKTPFLPPAYGLVTTCRS